VCVCVSHTQCMKLENDQPKHDQPGWFCHSCHAHQIVIQVAFRSTPEWPPLVTNIGIRDFGRGAEFLDKHFASSIELAMTTWQL